MTASERPTLIPSSYPELESERPTMRCPESDLDIPLSVEWADEVEESVDAMFIDLDLEYIAEAMVDDAIPPTWRSVS